MLRHVNACVGVPFNSWNFLSVTARWLYTRWMLVFLWRCYVLLVSSRWYNFPGWVTRVVNACVVIACQSSLGFLLLTLCSHCMPIFCDVPSAKSSGKFLVQDSFFIRAGDYHTFVARTPRFYLNSLGLPAIRRSV